MSEEEEGLVYLSKPFVPRNKTSLFALAKLHFEVPDFGVTKFFTFNNNPSPELSDRVDKLRSSMGTVLEIPSVSPLFLNDKSQVYGCDKLAVYDYVKRKELFLNPPKVDKPAKPIPQQAPLPVDHEGLQELDAQKPVVSKDLENDINSVFHSTPKSLQPSNSSMDAVGSIVKLNSTLSEGIPEVVEPPPTLLVKPKRSLTKTMQGKQDIPLPAPEPAIPVPPFEEQMMAGPPSPDVKESSPHLPTDVGVIEEPEPPKIKPSKKESEEVKEKSVESSSEALADSAIVPGDGEDHPAQIKQSSESAASSESSESAKAKAKKPRSSSGSSSERAKVDPKPKNSTAASKASESDSSESKPKKHKSEKAKVKKPRSSADSESAAGPAKHSSPDNSNSDSSVHDKAVLASQSKSGDSSNSEASDEKTSVDEVDSGSDASGGPISVRKPKRTVKPIDKYDDKNFVDETPKAKASAKAAGVKGEIKRRSSAVPINGIPPGERSEIPPPSIAGLSNLNNFKSRGRGMTRFYTQGWCKLLNYAIHPAVFVEFGFANRKTERADPEHKYVQEKPMLLDFLTNEYRAHLFERPDTLLAAEENPGNKKKLQLQQLLYIYRDWSTSPVEDGMTRVHLSDPHEWAPQRGYTTSTYTFDWPTDSINTITFIRTAIYPLQYLIFSIRTAIHAMIHTTDPKRKTYAEFHAPTLYDQIRDKLCNDWIVASQLSELEIFKDWKKYDESSIFG